MKSLIGAFSGLLVVPGLMLAPAAHADACDGMATARAHQLCEISLARDPNLGDTQRQPPLNPDASAIAGGMADAPPIPADAPQIAGAGPPTGDLNSQLFPGGGVPGPAPQPITPVIAPQPPPGAGVPVLYPGGPTL
jgi:hypothetical protein